MPLAAWRVAPGFNWTKSAVTADAELTPGGIGCVELPWLGLSGFAPVLGMGVEKSFDGAQTPRTWLGAGISMISSSHRLRFIGIDTLESTRSVMVTNRGIKVTASLGVPVSTRGSITLGTATEFPIFSGGKRELTLSGGFRLPF